MLRKADGTSEECVVCLEQTTKKFVMRGEGPRLLACGRCWFTYLMPQGPGRRVGEAILEARRRREFDVNNPQKDWQI